MCRLLHPKADYIFDQWWQAKWWIRHATAFWNGRNWAKKLIFLAHFESFFVYTPVHPTRYIPRFCQLKYLIKIYICDKFNQYSICGCEIKNFQSLLFWSSINEMAPFWDCLGPLPQILLGLPDMKTVFKKSFKILNFGSNGMQLKFTVLIHIGAQYTDGKPKILVKTKISAKTTFSEIINNVTPRSQKNHIILVKLSHKAFSGPKLGLNYHHGSKGHHKFSHRL